MATQRLGADRIRFVFAIIVIAISLGSLVVWQPPMQLALISVATGLIAGVIWGISGAPVTERPIPDESKLRMLAGVGRGRALGETTLDLVGAVVLGIGIQYVTDRADGIGSESAWWQPGLLTVGTVCAIYPLVLRIRGLKSESPNGVR
jgi:MFS family permease